MLASVRAIVSVTVAVTLLAGCRRAEDVGGESAAPVSPGKVRAAPVQDSPVAVPARDPAVAPTLDQTFAMISAGRPLPRICFAVSKNHHRAACAVGGWTRHEQLSLGILIVGETGDLESSWAYTDRTWKLDDHPWAAPSDLVVFDRVRKALRERGYVPNVAPETRLGPQDMITLGRWTIRRQRVVVVPSRAYDPAIDRNAFGDPEPQGGVQAEYAEHLLLRCGRDWVEIPIVPGHRYAEEGDHFVSLLTDNLLLVTALAPYGTEGDYGGERTATAFDLRALCERP
jgi:hypothetical protein